MPLEVMASGLKTGDADGPPVLRCSTACDLAPSLASSSKVSDGADGLQQPAQRSASPPAAPLPSAAASAPAVSAAGGQQAARRPVSSQHPNMQFCLCICMQILIAADQSMPEIELGTRGLALSEPVLCIDAIIMI